MIGENLSRTRLTTLAAACLLTVALPAGTAMAQKVKTPAATTETAAPAPAEFTVEIPTIDAVDANVDEDTLRDIFSGNVLDNADALAGLSATSITIPEITVSYSAGEGETATAGAFTLTDIELTDVTDGIAASIAMGSAGFDSGEEGTATFGVMSASQFDIGGVLRLYGLVDTTGASTELATIYQDFTFEGGSLNTPQGDCTIGSMEAAEFKARPLNYSFADIMTLTQSMEAEGENPSPENIGQLLRVYADIFTAFESAPVTFGGFDCDVVDMEGNAVAMSVAGMSIDGFRPGFYPAFNMEGLDITVEGDGQVSIGNFDIKEMDLSGPIALVQSMPDTIDQAWLESNARGLIPAFAGMSFSDIAVDVPNTEAPDERIVASIGSFDLSLGNYINGLPSDISTEATNIVTELPADSADETVQQLIGLGVTSIDAGFKVALAWDEAANTINVEEASVTGAGLANIILSGTLTNATEALFAVDSNEAMAAGMAVALKNLHLEILDEGLSDIILASVAAEQGSNAEAMRPVFAGLAEGTIVGFLAGAAEAQKVGAAVSAFVGGQAKSLTIDLVAKQDPGLGMMDFMAAEQDPTQLIGKVTIDATAK